MRALSQRAAPGTTMLTTRLALVGALPHAAAGQARRVQRLPAACGAPPAVRWCPGCIAAATNPSCSLFMKASDAERDQAGRAAISVVSGKRPFRR